MISKLRVEIVCVGQTRGRSAGFRGLVTTSSCLHELLKTHINKFLKSEGKVFFK